MFRTEFGLDTDRFDRLCDHLVVRENASGDIVGTYRLLTPGAALASGVWQRVRERRYLRHFVVSG